MFSDGVDEQDTTVVAMHVIADYGAIVHGLTFALEQGVEYIRVYVDSEEMVREIQGSIDNSFKSLYSSLTEFEDIVKCAVMNDLIRKFKFFDATLEWPRINP
jgi:ribonuclease HI